MNINSPMGGGVKTRIKDSVRSELWVFKAVTQVIPNTIQTIRAFKLSDVQPRNLPSTILRTFKGTDMFGYSPIVQFDSFRSVFGGFFSICCIIGIIIYMVITGTKFFRAPVPKSQVDDYSDVFGVEAPLIGARFTSASGANYYDEDQFRFAFTLNIVHNSNLSTKETVTLKTKMCDYYKFADLDFNPLPGYETPLASDVLCIDLSQQEYILNNRTVTIGNLSGVFEDPLYRYIQLEMFMCDYDKVNNTCVPEANLSSIILGGNANIMWYNMDVTDVKGVNPHLGRTRSWKSYRFNFAPNIVVYKDIYVTKGIVTHTSSWPLGNNDVVEIYRETQMIDSLTAFTSNKRILKYIWRLDGRMGIEQWTPATVFDLIGSWGAFWSSLLLILGTFAALYNEKKWQFLVENKQIEVEGDGTVFDLLGKKIGRSESVEDFQTLRKESSKEEVANSKGNIAQQKSASKYEFRTTKDALVEPPSRTMSAEIIELPTLKEEKDVI